MFKRINNLYSQDKDIMSKLDIVHDIPIPPKPKDSRELLMDSIQRLADRAIRMSRFNYRQSIEIEGKHVEISIKVSSDETKSENNPHAG